MKIYSPETITGATGNITTVPLAGDIQTYINAATAGDVLVLSPGTYTITSTLTIDKNIHISGNSQGNTFLYTSGGSDPMIDYVGGDISSASISSICIYASSIGTLIRNYNQTRNYMALRIDNTTISATSMTGGGNAYGLYLKNSALTMTNSIIDADQTSSDGSTCYGVYIYASGNVANSAKVYGSYIKSRNALDKAIGFCVDNTGTKVVVASIYDSSILAVRSNGGLGPANSYVGTGSNCASRLYNCRLGSDELDGTNDYDVVRTAGTVSLWGCTLDKNATSGTITQNGSFLGDGLNVTSSTGGTGSAGSGKQYVTLKINGSQYKLLHDGTV